MKKIIFILCAFLMVVGCENISNTPTKQVEGLFNQYQTLDITVLNDLNNVILEEGKLSQSNREEYREIIKKQYKDLVYKIKDEKIDGDVATVTAEITVTDFSKILTAAYDHKNNNPNEFVDIDGIYDQTLYYDYIISKMKDAKERIKYTLDIKLNKIDGKWIIDKLDKETEEKILGIYQY